MTVLYEADNVFLRNVLAHNMINSFTFSYDPSYHLTTSAEKRYFSMLYNIMIYSCTEHSSFYDEKP